MTAVLVHGVPDTYRVWDRVRGQLVRADVVALSLPGFDNPAPAGFASTKEACAGWIIQQLEAIGEPVDLVGHDWGCMLTGRVASIRPDLVRTWTGISGPIDPEYEWHDFANTWQTPGEGERWMAGLDLDEFAEQLATFHIPIEDARIDPAREPRPASARCRRPANGSDARGAGPDDDRSRQKWRPYLGSGSQSRSRSVE